jgi:hypothetical protein
VCHVQPKCQEFNPSHTQNKNEWWVWNGSTQPREYNCGATWKKKYHGGEHYSRDHKLFGHSIVSQHFMEPEGSIPNSQELFTCPYPEPDQSSPHHPHPTSTRSILILSKHLRLGLPSGLLPSGFPTNNLYEFLFSPFVLHAPPISSSSP